MPATTTAYSASVCPDSDVCLPEPRRRSTATAPQPNRSRDDRRKSLDQPVAYPTDVLQEQRRTDEQVRRRTRRSSDPGDRRPAHRRMAQGQSQHRLRPGSPCVLQRCGERTGGEARRSQPVSQARTPFESRPTRYPTAEPARDRSLRGARRRGRPTSTISGIAKTGTFYLLPKRSFVRTIALTDPARERLLSLPRESDFAFTTLRGSRYRPSSCSYHWNRVRCAAGFGNVDLYTATRHPSGGSRSTSSSFLTMSSRCSADTATAGSLSGSLRAPGCEDRPRARPRGVAAGTARARSARRAGLALGSVHEVQAHAHGSAFAGGA